MGGALESVQNFIIAEGLKRDWALSNRGSTMCRLLCCPFGNPLDLEICFLL